MDVTSTLGSQRTTGDLEGQFLVAMPGMLSSVFADSVIYLCAHSSEGAMGFIVNKPSEMTLSDLVEKAGLDTPVMPNRAVADEAAGPLRVGGPVDEHRGFVLHSTDYETEATMRLSGDVALTSTLDVLKAIAQARGPSQAALMLGYSGWGAGQLEQEIRDNAWLTVEADPSIVFDHDHGRKHPSLIAGFGISAANFIADGGNA